MDMYIERIVKKELDYLDYLIMLGTILLSFIAAYIIMSITGPLYFGVGLALVIALGVFGYLIITSRNVEYEYSLTDGDLVIEKIIAKRKRKRIFSGSCRQFEMIDMVSSDKHKKAVNGAMVKIRAASSMNSEGAYFFITQYNHKRAIVYFEPDSEILNSIKTINRKAFG